MSKSSPKVFFNASVIIAGFISPSGGSGKLLKWIKEKKIYGIISEIILQEVIRNFRKIGLPEKEIEERITKLFPQILPPSDAKHIKHYENMVIVSGDAHVLASAVSSRSRYLITLDQKHILSLKSKIKDIKIVSPRELITFLARER